MCVCTSAARQLNDEWRKLRQRKTAQSSTHAYAMRDHFRKLFPNAPLCHACYHII